MILFIKRSLNQNPSNGTISAKILFEIAWLDNNVTAIKGVKL